jgi:hypothetical protein
MIEIDGGTEGKGAKGEEREGEGEVVHCGDGWGGGWDLLVVMMLGLRDWGEDINIEFTVEGLAEEGPGDWSKSTSWGKLNYLLKNFPFLYHWNVSSPPLPHQDGLLPINRRFLLDTWNILLGMDLLIQNW